MGPSCSETPLAPFDLLVDDKGPNHGKQLHLLRLNLRIDPLEPNSF